MYIKFYYIPGISETDTLSFLGMTNSQRDTFIDRFLIKDIELSYYPPHYKNVIKVDAEDIDFNINNVNFVCLEYKKDTDEESVRYYYFIDSVDYKSPTVTSMSIHMDVITTYFNNLDFKYSFIERKMITRFEEGVINRGYIRENLSNADFRLTYYKGFGKYSSYGDTNNKPNLVGFLVFNLTEDIYDSSNVVNAPSYNHGELANRQQYHQYLVPIVSDGKTNTMYKYQYYDTSDPDNPYYHDIITAELNTTIHDLSVDSHVANAYFLPLDCLLDCVKEVRRDNDDTLVVVINEKKCWVRYHLAHTHHCAAIYLDKQIRNYVVPHDYDIMSLLPFTSVLGGSYSSSKIISMLDNNYIKVNYGERNALATFPLELVDTLQSLYAMYCCDYTTGARYYWIKSSSITPDAHDYTLSYPDEVNSMVMTSNDNNLDVLSDPYVNWISYNRATIPMQYLGLVVNSLIGGGIAGLKGAIKGAQSSEKSMLNTATDMYNAVWAPDTPRIRGEWASNYVGNCTRQMLTIYKVEDYEEVAFKYHMFGNLVNEVTMRSDLINYITNRRYFNYVKIKECDVDLLLHVNDQDTISNIKQRFINGIRFWSIKQDRTGTVASFIGDFSMDNLEL